MMKKLLFLTLLTISIGAIGQQKALNLNGTSQYVEVPYNAALNTVQLTVEAWANASIGASAGYHAVVSSRDDNPKRGYIIYQTPAGKWEFWLGTNNNWQVLQGPDIEVGKWTHLAGTYDGSKVRFMVDGVQVDSANLNMTQGTDVNPLRIGAGSNEGPASFFFQGKIDNVRIWNQPRSLSAIKADMFKTLSPGPAGLVADYRFDEASGNTAVNSVTTVPGTDGTLMGNATRVSSPILFSQNALHFDGSNDQVIVGAASDTAINFVQPMGQVSFTIEGWVNPSSIKYSSIISTTGFNNSVPGLGGYDISLLQDGHIQFAIADQQNALDAVETTVSIAANTWTHVAVTFNHTNREMRIYINGSLNKLGQAQENFIRPSSYPLTLGAYATPGFSHFHGALDEVRFWNVAKSGAEIAAAMNGPVAGTAPNLTAYFTMNQGIPNGTNTGLSTLVDLAGNRKGVMQTFALSGDVSNFIDPFIPSIAGVESPNIWFRADKGVNAGANFNWLNYGVLSGADAAQATAANQPMLQSTGISQINFNPTLGFDGSDDFLQTPAITILPDNAGTRYGSQFVVFRRKNNDNPIYQNCASCPWGVGITLGGEMFQSNKGRNTPTSANKVYMLDMKGSTSQSSTTLSANINGSGTGINEDNRAFTPNDGHPLQIGSYDVYFASMDLAELIIFGKEVTDAERNKVQSYLALKYGISLGNNVDAVSYQSSAGTSIWTANSSYKYDIFGIGADSASQLNQPASSSANTSAGDGSGLPGMGNIVISATATLNNGSFLLTGHDNGSLATQTTEIPAGVTQRVGREWYVQHTNDVGTITLSFDATGLTAPMAGVTEYKLLLDTDNDFSTGATVINASSINGNKVNFEMLNLPNGSYFTFALVINQSKVLWLKGDAGVSPANGTLTGWTDQTGINQFTVSGNPQTGVSKINFNNAVDFDGNGDYLKGNTNIPFQTLYAVVKRDPDLNSPYGTLVSGEKASGPVYMMQGGNLFTANITSDGNDFLVVSTTAQTQIQANVMGMELVDNSLSESRVYIDGTYHAMTYISRNTPPKIVSGIPYVGSEITSKYFHGQIAEVMMLNYQPTDAQRNQIQSYLALKYGITLDKAIGSYVNSAGDPVWNNTTYWHDVFGIGQDDQMGLLQDYSNSINTGSGDGTGQNAKCNLVFGLPSDLDNGDFLVAGHDNGPLVEQTTDLPASINLPGTKRIGREWKVQHTGTVGTISIALDLTGLPTTGYFPNDFAIIIDLDGNGDFTDGTVIVKESHSSFNGELIEFTNVDLPDGAVFSFVTSAIGPILPLKLENFTVVMNNCDAQLQWTSSNETNLKNFELEIDNGSGWQKAQSIAATGNNSSQSQSYKALVAATAGKTFLARLKMVDLDGKSSYSNSISFRCGQGKWYNIYPNPAKNQVQVVGTQQREPLRIVNASGAVMQQQSGTDGKTIIQISSLAAGTYFVQALSDGTWQQVGRFIKQ